MALIFEFKKSQFPNRKPAPVVSTGAGSIVFFTGIRYERIVQAEVVAANKSAMTRKRTQRRARQMEVLA